MRIKDGLMLCKVGDSSIVMASGSTMHMSGLTTLNATGEFIWQTMQQDVTVDEIVSAMRKEFDIDEATARADVLSFVEKLKNAGFLA